MMSEKFKRIVVLLIVLSFALPVLGIIAFEILKLNG